MCVCMCSMAVRPDCAEKRVVSKVECTIRDISDQELISCLHDQFTIRNVHGGDSLYLYTLF